jgi:hypothetical protein
MVAKLVGGCVAVIADMARYLGGEGGAVEGRAAGLAERGGVHSLPHSPTAAPPRSVTSRSSSPVATILKMDRVVLAAESGKTGVGGSSAVSPPAKAVTAW